MVVDNAAIVGAGLRVLIGQPVDRDLLDRLRLLAKLDSCDVRAKVAQVLAGDESEVIPNEAVAVEKAGIIVDSMETTPACKDAQLTLGIADDFCFQKFSWAEFSLSLQAHALAQLRALPEGFLRTRSVALPPLAHDAFVLAKALAGDTSAKADTWAVLTNSTGNLLRREALRIVARNPDAAGIEILKKVARDDPSEARPAGGYFHMPDADQTLKFDPKGKIHPLRFLAAQELKKLGIKLE